MKKMAGLPTPEILSECHDAKYSRARLAGDGLPIINGWVSDGDQTNNQLSD